MTPQKKLLSNYDCNKIWKGPSEPLCGSRVIVEKFLEKFVLDVNVRVNSHGIHSTEWMVCERHRRVCRCLFQQTGQQEQKRNNSA